MTTPAEEFYVLLGRRIQEARKKRHVTQKTLGGMLVPPVSRASIANIETGKQGVLAYTLAQIVVALGTTADALMPAVPAVDTAAAWKTELEQKLPPEISQRLHLTLSRLPGTGVNDGGSNRPKRR